MPSLHAGFALALGVAVLVSARSLPVRIAGALWGPLVILAVVATGNHFLIDIAAGLLLTGVGLGVALLLRRRGERDERDSVRGSASRHRDDRRTPAAEAPR